MGLLLFVPVLIFFVYPHFAFHDGWIGPHKVGLTIGSVLLLSTMAPAFRLAHAMGETGNLSPKLLLAMNSPGFSKIREAADLPYELSIESTEPHSNGSIAKTPIIRPELIKREEETIRSLYSLESQLDSLDLLAPATRRSTVPPPRDSHFAAAAFGPDGRTEIPSYAHAPPLRHFPVGAGHECPAGTQTHTNEDRDREEEWCQQRPHTAVCAKRLVCAKPRRRPTRIDGANPKWTTGGASGRGSIRRARSGHKQSFVRGCSTVGADLQPHR